MMSALNTPSLRRWTYEKWDRAVEAGVFARKRVELIDGKIVEMSPQSEPHVVSIMRAAARLRRIFREPEFSIRAQFPLRLGRSSDPEPDVAVVKGPDTAYLEAGHPQTALLVVEVSFDTIRYDRGVKGSLYASAGIADYWIINLPKRQCEVHRKPVRDAKTKFGWRYGEIAILEPRDSVTPLAAKRKSIKVADMLP
jgi:Uma2 family endonuclease